LPNNKNVFLAAKQAAELYEDAKVHIVPTESIMQGYGALSVITPGITDIDMLVRNAQSAARGVKGAEITHAVRDVTINGKEVKRGDYIAISDHEIIAVAKTPEDALIAMLTDSPDVEDYEILTLFVGKDVSDERRAEITDRLEEEFPDLELTVYEGAQEVYDYLIALE
jgi:dihydroxyacetone kinase-like predicted kinase